LLEAKVGQSSDLAFKEKVGKMKYQSLFNTGYKTLFTIDGDFDYEKFWLIRTAFELRMFSTADYSGAVALTENELCYSVSQGKCVSSDDETDYCALDGAGNPTPSSDFCP
jgi:hypothetical protein